MSYLDGFIAIIHVVFQNDVEVPKGSIVDFAHVFWPPDGKGDRFTSTNLGTSMMI